ncbi:pentapeptide repeat-containing protein [Rhodococcus sp. O3]|uniref:pentapeptide repeat-containing protein n=1 Tax=Rhodococcus sp. O3 TaxID=3404919 RepID=UPI003B66E363
MAFWTWSGWKPVGAAAAVVGALFTAVGVVLGGWFTHLTLGNANETLKITQHGQIAERFGRAVEQLASDKADVRLGGVYSLANIAEQSPTDQPAVIDVLSAFIRVHAPMSESCVSGPTHLRPPAEIQAALTTIVTRDPSHDGSLPVDLSQTCLVGADLSGDAQLAGADLSYSNLSEAKLPHADLSGASLFQTDLTKAQLTERAKLTGANLTVATLNFADLTNADMTYATLIGACLKRTNLTGANLYRADLSGAKLAGAKLAGTTYTPVCPDGPDVMVPPSVVGLAEAMSHETDAQLNDTILIQIFYDDQSTIWPIGYQAPPSRPQR